jgi:two-component system, cell cycle sensor histidine kinase and response regulator CckA
VELAVEHEEVTQARNAPATSLERYTTLYDLARVGYVSLDRAGTIHHLNLAGALLLGGERTGVVGTPFSRYLSPETRPAFRAVLGMVLDGRGKGVCEVSLQTHASPPRVVRIEATAAEGGEECRAVLVDISDRKRLEEEWLLRTKLEATGVLAAGIAHDFNNLLSVILGHLELLGDPGRDPAPHRAAALQAVQEARGLSQQFLTFAKGGRPARTVLDMAEVLRAAATLVLRGTPVTCDFALPGDLWSVEGDATQLGRVVQNLVLNAREAMPSGGCIAIRAENVAKPPPAVRVTIVDSGQGIPADLLPKIFDPYFSTKERGAQRGTGLGLTVCRAVVAQHGGTLTVASTLGVGTTAQFLLPAAAATPATPRPAPVPQPGMGRLLVMDDEAKVLIILATLLRHLGYTVELAAHGEEAVARYRAAHARGERFDAVLLDLTVRGGAGAVPTLQALRRFDPGVTAVVVSGYADDPVLVDPQRHGFQGALAKPHGLSELRELLARVLGR